MALGTFHGRGMGLPRTTGCKIYSKFPRRLRANMATFHTADSRWLLRGARILQTSSEE